MLKGMKKGEKGFIVGEDHLRYIDDVLENKEKNPLYMKRYLQMRFGMEKYQANMVIKEFNRRFEERQAYLERQQQEEGER